MKLRRAAAFRRSLCSGLTLLALPALPAQVRPPAPSPVPEAPVVLAQFEVSPEGDDGYKAANAISGTSFNTARGVQGVRPRIATSALARGTSADQN